MSHTPINDVTPVSHLPINDVTPTSHLPINDVTPMSHLPRVPGRGGGLGSRPKKMYGESLGDGVEYHLMSPTPRR